MSHVAIQIDMDRLQSTVQAVVRPTVEKLLSEQDLEKIVSKVLLEKKKHVDPYFHYHFQQSEPVACLLERLVQSSIKEIAKQYVESEIRQQTPFIEEAFRKMMQGSSNRLVKAFAKATERALAEDWSFELDVKVEHTIPERERD